MARHLMRIWCETLPYEKVRDPGLLGLLRRSRIELLLAVRPADVAGIAEVARVCAGEGVTLAVWPMLDDADGRWANARNAASFVSFVNRIEDAMQTAGHPCAEVAVDLEPPIEEMRAWLAGAPGRALAVARRRVDAYAGARRLYVDLVRDLAARGVASSAAALPFVLFDRAGSHPTWQKLLGTPVEGPEFAHVSVMLYTSLLEGWSRGLLKRRDARAILATLCRAVVQRFGATGGVSLGAVGTGALGDEPVYQSPAELAEDVGIARALGVSRLTLFDLGGVIARPPAEAWLDAFVETPAVATLPEETLASRAALSIVDASASSVRALLPLLRWGGRAGRAAQRSAK